MKRRYKIELDIFSGQKNPSFEISEEDFNSIYKDVIKHTNKDFGHLYDGLGFRGFILSAEYDIYIFIQKNIAKIEFSNYSKYYDIDSKFLVRAFDIFKELDFDKKYIKLIESEIEN